MRSGIINETSKITDVVGVLTGSWYEYDRMGWHVVKTPFVLSMSGSFAAGPVEFPTIPNRYGIARWANNTSSGNILVKPKQTNIVLPQNLNVSLNIVGFGAKH